MAWGCTCVDLSSLASLSTEWVHISAQREEGCGVSGLKNAFWIKVTSLSKLTFANSVCVGRLNAVRVPWGESPWGWSVPSGMQSPDAQDTLTAQLDGPRSCPALSGPSGWWIVC